MRSVNFDDIEFVSQLDSDLLILRVCEFDDFGEGFDLRVRPKYAAFWRDGCSFHHGKSGPTYEDPTHCCTSEFGAVNEITRDDLDAIVSVFLLQQNIDTRGIAERPPIDHISNG